MTNSILLIMVSVVLMACSNSSDGSSDALSVSIEAPYSAREQALIDHTKHMTTANERCFLQYCIEQGQIDRTSIVSVSEGLNACINNIYETQDLKDILENDCNFDQ